MKKHILNTVILLSVFLVSCNNDFMDRFPETSISPEAFFQTTKDLELYTNTYYTYISPKVFDYVSDNCLAYAENHYNNDMIRGNLTPSNVTGWSKDTWGELRRYNFFLDNVHKATGEPEIIRHHIGLTRLQRANFYYMMVKWYSDLPWYSHSLTDTDEEELYKKQDPRTLVVDSIMADLDYATKYMSEEMGNRTMFSRWYALAMKARICLHEGTFRKYHAELELQSTADKYLQEALAAAEEIMNSGLFEIDKNGGKDKAYQLLFTNMDLSKSPEMILFKDYDNDALIRHNSARETFNWVTNYSRSLMESYQYITSDGKAVPFSTISGYETKKFTEVFENRDPRFKQTFMYPGFVLPGESQASRPNLNLGGYPVIKFMAPTADQYGGGAQYTDLPVARYAEILLIFAEAKAELGTITQADLDKSINLIRDRVELPPTVIGQIVSDPTLKAQFPGISNELLLEIRRERRVELVSEDFRWDDLHRWSAGNLIEQVQEGIYLDKFGVFDISGDGVPEMGVYEDEASNPIPENDRGNYSFYYLKSNTGSLNTFTLSKGTSGHIVLNGEIGSRKFVEPRSYYWPIPITQITVNPNLEQNKFWK